MLFENAVPFKSRQLSLYYENVFCEGTFCKRRANLSDRQVVLRRGTVIANCDMVLDEEECHAFDGNDSLQEEDQLSVLADKLSRLRLFMS